MTELENRIRELEALTAELASENLMLRKAQTEKENCEILFSDYITKWLYVQKDKVRFQSWLAYENQVTKHIAPYFAEKKLTLSQLTPVDIEAYYYDKLSEGLSATTIERHHSNIHSALKSAVKSRLIFSNPDDYTDRPKKEKFTATVLTADELNTLLKGLENNEIYLPVLLSSTLGLRRGEVLGLKWSAIDFENNLMHINHTVIRAIEKGENIYIRQDKTKTEGSNRTIPMPPLLASVLRREKRKQIERYIQNRDSYCKSDIGYVCVKNNGELIPPERLSFSFRYFVRKLVGKKVRFHDLRHTCASLLVESGLPLKAVSVWLGHSSVTMTDRYLHSYESDEQKIAQHINGCMAMQAQSHKNVQKSTRVEEK